MRQDACRKELEMTDILKLNSVGAYISTGGEVRPMLANGKPDMTDYGGDVRDCSEEWFDALDPQDSDLVQWIMDDMNRWAQVAEVSK